MLIFILSSMIFETDTCNDKKQPPRGFPRKRCFENIQQIYSRSPMPKCDFNKVALQIYWNFIYSPLRHGWSAVNFLHIFKHLLLRAHLGGCFWVIILIFILSLMIFETGTFNANIFQGSTEVRIKHFVNDIVYHVMIWYIN